VIYLKKEDEYYAILSKRDRESFPVMSFDAVSAVLVVVSMHFYRSYRFISDVSEWSKEVTSQRKRRVNSKECLIRTGMTPMAVGRKPCRSL
jgi:hypothetical protein